MNSAATKTVCTGVRGISPAGNHIVQSRKGGGFMVLRRLDPYAGHVVVAETEGYVEACIVMDAVATANGDSCVDLQGDAAVIS